MFTQPDDTLVHSPVHFYGNDGVCLFKFFVRSDDARRNRQTQLMEENPSVLDLVNFQGDLVLWIVLTINFFCFLIIAVSYVMITEQTWKSSAHSSRGQNTNAERIQRRLSLMILTDFLCWVPFIIVCALHNVHFIDATDWYVFFTMIVLPANSVINPLLYDKENTIMLGIRKIGSRVYSSKIMRSLRQRSQNGNSQRSGEKQDPSQGKGKAIPMGVRSGKLGYLNKAQVREVQMFKGGHC